MKRDKLRRKVNNSGFSLLEVLIAMVILTIVCVPLLRSFATGAHTNSKAKIKMKATTAAENIMEDIKTMTDEELMAKVDLYKDSSNVNDAVYNSTSGNPTITLTIRDNDEMKSELPDGYYAKVILDPNNDGSTGKGAYPNANGLNISEFEPISVSDCAIYTMSERYDEEAYEVFMSRNQAYLTAHGKPASDKKDKEFFEKNLERIIRIYIETDEPYTDENGETKDTVRAKLQIEYKLNISGIVEGETEKKYLATDSYFFDNTVSHKELNGIYLFYYPRYDAAKLGNETILINNNKNIDTDVYVTSIKRPDYVNGECDTELKADPMQRCHFKHEDSMKRKEYYNFAYLNLKIIENSSKDADKAHVKLRTNLLNTDASTSLRTPYSKKDDSNGYGLAFKVTYQGSDGTLGPVSGKIDNGSVMKMVKLLSIGDIDGKNLDTDLTPIRIYNLSVEICDSEDNVIVDMDGTKLKQY